MKIKPTKESDLDPLLYIEELEPRLPDGRLLSECLSADARQVSQGGPEYAELGYRLGDCVQLAEDLELALKFARAAVDAAVERAESAEDELLELQELLLMDTFACTTWGFTRDKGPRRRGAQELRDTARAEVEHSLHADGIIEDPDTDGGLLG